MTPRVRTTSVEDHDRASIVIDLARETGPLALPGAGRRGRRRRHRPRQARGRPAGARAVDDADQAHHGQADRRAGLAASRPAPADPPRGRLPDGDRARRVRRPGRHRHPRGRHRGDRRRHRRRARPTRRPGPDNAATAPGRCRGCCAPTRSRTSPRSSCPTTRTTTPSPGSSCGPWVGSRRPVTWPRCRCPTGPTRDESVSSWPSSLCCTWTDCGSTGSVSGCSTATSRPTQAPDAGGQSMSAPLALTIAVVLLLANAFFVGAEFALISARRSQIEPKADGRFPDGPVDPSGHGERQSGDGRRPARASRSARWVSVPSASRPWHTCIEPVLHAAQRARPAPPPHRLRDRRSLIVVYLHVVLGEMVPKNIALAGPERAALVLGPPMMGIVTVLRPVISALNAIANADAATDQGRAAGRGQLDVHPRRGGRAGRGVARRGPDREGRVRPARGRARLHREDRRRTC